MDLLTRLYNPPEPKIREGEWYVLAVRVPIGGKAFATRRIKLRAVKKYKHVVLFEDEKGIRECWTMWEIARCLA